MLSSYRSAFLFLILLISAAHVQASRCQVKAAQAYIKALVSHSKEDADAVPLEENVVRYEGPPGLATESANDAKSLRESLVSGPSSYTVYQAEDEQYTTLNSTAIEAVYIIKVGLLDGTLPLTTAKVDEYFTFKSAGACKIQRINAIIFVGED